MKPTRSFSTLLGFLIASSAVAHTSHDETTHEANQPQTVVVVEYSDFHCEPCVEVPELLEKLVEAKKVPLQVIFKHAPSHPDALLAHETALAAGQQGKFWEMHDLLFDNPKAGYAELLDMAASLELDVKRLQSALDEREFRGEVMDNLAEARGLGVRSTPTLFLNGTKLEGIDQIRSFVQAVLAPPSEPEDSEKVYTFGLEGSPSVGPEDAPVTIVEFSDFRCGFCRAHSQTLTELAEAYPGKIRRVFKHFPIQVDATGKLPHQGAMAAMAQGRFWEMYQALMKSPLDGWNAVMACASEVGLDLERFQQDLNAPAAVAIVQRDIEEGDRHGIMSTPTTFINGKRISGRQSLESLKERIDSMLGSNAGVARLKDAHEKTAVAGPNGSVVSDGGDSESCCDVEMAATK